MTATWRLEGALGWLLLLAVLAALHPSTAAAAHPRRPHHSTGTAPVLHPLAPSQRSAHNVAQRVIHPPPAHGQPPLFLEQSAHAATHRPAGARARRTKSGSTRHSSKRISFAERARRRARLVREKNDRRAGPYWRRYLHRGTHLDFGCGSHGRKCVCPLPLNASFDELQVEGARLRAEQRLQESSACFAQAMDTYLERVGRYYGGGPQGAAGDLDAHMPATGGSGATGSPVAPVPLSPETAADAHATAQALVDRLNRGPGEDWSLKRRRRSPTVERLAEVGRQSDEVGLAADAVHHFESFHPGQSILPLGHHSAHRPFDEAKELAPERARKIARIYEQQLREQWKEWGKQEGQQPAGAGKKRR